jgi:hypothetical protein
MESCEEESKKQADDLVVTNTKQLARYGVCRAKLPTTSIDWHEWATRLSQVALENVGFEGDGEYAFYRNIMEEPGFPFDAILKSEVGQAMVRHFDMMSLDEVRLHDAFCVHYNMEQDDTSGARHVDPSDITVNICIEKSPNATGSRVKFYGTMAMKNVERDSTPDDKEASSEFCFLVDQEPGYATIHWGGHPHETMRLESGTRTNIVMTFWYVDKSRSKAGMRTCYA